MNGKKENTVKIRPNKRAVWLKHYLNELCPDTFLNGTESAKRAGYKASSEESFQQIGSQNFRKLKGSVDKWLDENGLSESALKIKLVSLLDAKETKFFQNNGIVTDQREVDAIETQRRALDMALKLKGMYAAEKHQISVTATVRQILDEIDGETKGLPSKV